MGHTEIIYMIALSSLATAFTRVSPLIFFGEQEISLFWKKWMSYLPISVLSALIASIVLYPDSRLNFSLSNPYLVPPGVAFIIGLKWQNLLLTLGAGMLSFALWSLYLERLLEKVTI